MRTIWEYSFNNSGDHTINMPCGAKILTVDEYQGYIYLWAEAPSAVEIPKENRFFKVFPTGVLFPDQEHVILSFIGTVKLLEENLVYHVYEHIKS